MRDLRGGRAVRSTAAATARARARGANELSRRAVARRRQPPQLLHDLRDARFRPVALKGQRRRLAEQRHEALAIRVEQIVVVRDERLGDVVGAHALLVGGAKSVRDADANRLAEQVASAFVERLGAPDLEVARAAAEGAAAGAQQHVRHRRRRSGTP